MNSHSVYSRAGISKIATGAGIHLAMLLHRLASLLQNLAIFPFDATAANYSSAISTSRATVLMFRRVPTPAGSFSFERPMPLGK